MDEEISGTRRVRTCGSTGKARGVRRSRQASRAAKTGERNAKKVLGNLDAGDEAKRYVTIERAANEYPVSHLCKVFGVSRSGYYAFLKRKEFHRDREDEALVKKVYEHYNGVYGYRQLQLFLLQDHGVWMNHKKVLRLMQMLGIRSRIRRKHRCNYASSTEGRVAKNLLKRDFQADTPNQKWVTDVTPYRVGESWIYLSAVKDLFKNEIVAYHMSQRNDNPLVLQTFEKAFSKTKDVTGLIVHSDQDSSTRLMHTTTCCQRLAPKSACLVEEIVMTMPRWRASSRISKRKDSTLMISEIWTRYKGKLKNISTFTTSIDHNES